MTNTANEKFTWTSGDVQWVDEKGDGETKPVKKPVAMSKLRTMQKQKEEAGND